MSLFNKDHYPTPDAVIDLMVQNTDLFGKRCLEPSAGAGNIVDYLNLHGADVSSCELDPDLAKIVSTKSKFLKHDFLEVLKEEVSHIDLIIMNPPFSKDVQHILHAWEIAPNGSQVIALCNYQTIKNNYSKDRHKLTQIISQYGNQQNLGSMFADAERETDVEIGLVHLWKPGTQDDFSGYFSEEGDPEEVQGYGIMPYNAVREAVQRYVSACKLFDQVAENAVKMNDLVGVFGCGKLTLSLEENQKERTQEHFRLELQKKAWLWIFQKLDMNKFMTQKLKEDINAFVEKQQNVPFTMNNIYRMIEMVIGTHGNRMKEVFVEVFDRLTKHYSENRYYVEGFKTNSHYMVNEKFILTGFQQSYRFCSDPNLIRVDYSSRSATLMDDFVKALNYMTGQNLGGFFHNYFSNKQRLIDPNDKDEEPQDLIYGVWYDYAYFQVKLFKKGTGHFKFKDRKVWEAFNRAVAKAKGYQLPEKV